MACRFARNCGNFYPDPSNERECLLLCNRNPLALSLVTMPDRYRELGIEDMKLKVGEGDPRSPAINLTKDLGETDEKTHEEKVQDQYNEMAVAVEQSGNEFIEYKPDLNVQTPKIQPNIKKLIKRSTGKISDVHNDPKITEAMQPIEHEDYPVHPLDDLAFQQIEQTGVMDQPKEPVNAEVYVSKRSPGRPPLSEEEKASRKEVRDKEKEEEESIKHQEAIDRRNAMKERARKAREAKKKKAEDKEVNAT